MPLPNSSSVQNQAIARAACHLRRTGAAQHHTPKETTAALKIKKPSGRLLLKRLLTKRAGARTSQSRALYSSTECAPCARIRHKNTRWWVRSTIALRLSVRRAWHRSSLFALTDTKDMPIGMPNVHLAHAPRLVGGRPGYFESLRQAADIGDIQDRRQALGQHTADVSRSGRGESFARLAEPMRLDLQ